MPKFATAQGKLDAAAFWLTATELCIIAGISRLCSTNRLALLNVPDSTNDLDGIIPGKTLILSGYVETPIKPYQTQKHQESKWGAAIHQVAV
jgi:hypothetical protein